jgi:hypothetical protein
MRWASAALAAPWYSTSLHSAGSAVGLCADNFEGSNQQLTKLDSHEGEHTLHNSFAISSRIAFSALCVSDSLLSHLIATCWQQQQQQQQKQQQQRVSQQATTVPSVT